jgi:hypothetical protein
MTCITCRCIGVTKGGRIEEEQSAARREEALKLVDGAT